LRQLHQFHFSALLTTNSLLWFARFLVFVFHSAALVVQKQRRAVPAPFQFFRVTIRRQQLVVGSCPSPDSACSLNGTMASSMEATSSASPKPNDIQWKESRCKSGGSDVDFQGDSGEDADMLFSMFSDPDPKDIFRFEFPHDILITLSGEKEENGQLLRSTGLTLWKASKLLCDYLTVHLAGNSIAYGASKLIEGKDVLELGAGLGLCGILAHKIGAKSVCISDGDIDTLVNLRTNVQHNNCNETTVLCTQLVWGEEEKAMPYFPCKEFDTILGADIVYIEESIAPLWKTVNALLSESGTFVLAFVHRNVAMDVVLEHGSQYGFHWCNATNTQENHETILVFKKEKCRSKD